MSTLTISQANRSAAVGFWTPVGAARGFDPQALANETMEFSRHDQCRLSEKLENLLLTRPASPFLAVDLDIIGSKYRELSQHFPSASIYYAVKANPAAEVVHVLAAMGSSF